METWDSLYEKCASCHACALGDNRTNCVFGTGNKNADLLFIGEAPGEQEDLTGTPFVGRAGQLLDKFLFAVDIPKTVIRFRKKRMPASVTCANSSVLFSQR